jgi:hypothetical protein
MTTRMSENLRSALGRAADTAASPPTRTKSAISGVAKRIFIDQPEGRANQRSTWTLKTPRRVLDVSDRTVSDGTPRTCQSRNAAIVPCNAKIYWDIELLTSRSFSLSSARSCGRGAERLVGRESPDWGFGGRKLFTEGIWFWRPKNCGGKIPCYLGTSSSVPRNPDGGKPRQ